MQNIRTFGLLALFTASAPAALSAHGLDILTGSANPARAGGNTAVYLTIDNEAFHTERLIGATSAIADEVELHAEREGRMVRVNGIEIPLSDRIDMRRSGHHIMLIGTKTDLTAGGVVPLRLQFGKNRFQNVNIRVGGEDAPASVNPTPHDAGHGK